MGDHLGTPGTASTGLGILWKKTVLICPPLVIVCLAGDHLKYQVKRLQVVQLTITVVSRKHTENSIALVGRGKGREKCQ